VSTVSAESSDELETVGKVSRRSCRKEEANVIDDDFREGLCSRPDSSVVSSEEVGKVCSRLDASVVSSAEVDKVQEEIRISRNGETGAWNETVGDIPEELMCTLCKHIMKDPMLIPCCCNSFCHNCIKIVLLGEKKCPNCGSLRCCVADLLPNRHLKSMIDVYFKSNPSVSSSGSCSSQATASQVVVANSQPETPHKKVSNQDIHVSKSVGSGILGKRKPLNISLNGCSKCTKSVVKK
jgi:hypothetical protein